MSGRELHLCSFPCCLACPSHVACSSGAPLRASDWPFGHTRDNQRKHRAVCRPTCPYSSSLLNFKTLLLGSCQLCLKMIGPSRKALSTFLPQSFQSHIRALGRQEVHLMADLYHHDFNVFEVSADIWFI